ncbi:MAG: PKD domain-containing protein [Brumimicrobium sp.]
MKRLYTFLFITFCYSSLLGQSSLYLKTPYDEAVFSTDTDSVTFLWNAVDAASYDLELSATSGFSSVQTFTTTENTYTVAVSDLTDTTYWRIAASNGTTSISERILSIHDLDNLGSLIYHIDAGEGVTLSNNRVTTWENSVSSNFTASQGVNSLRPELLENRINGRNVISFGGNIGSNQHRLSMTPLTIENLNFTLFIVYRQKSINSALPYILGYQGGGRSGGIHARGTAGTFFNFGSYYNNPEVFRRINSVGNFNWGIRSMLNNSIFLNSTEAGIYTGTGVDGFRMNMIGTRPDLTSLNFHGDLAEVIVYSNQLSVSDRQLVDEYLITKYHPYPDLGIDIDTCTSQITLGAIDDPAFSSVTWSTGETDQPNITVDENGWYWVEAEAFGRTVRDSIFIEGLVPKPILSQENDTTLCLFDTLDISYNNMLPTGITSEWHDGSTNTNYEAFENDTIYNLFSNSNGCSISSDSIILDINEFPETEGLGLDRTVCLNTELFFEYGNASNSPYSHLWGDGSTDPSFEPTTVGTQDYTIEVTDDMGCVAFDTVEIELVNTEGPLVDFTFDTVCPYSEHFFTDESVPASGDLIAQYTWRFPSDTLMGSSTPYNHTDTLSYIVELEVETNAGCSNIKRDTVTFYNKPSLSFSTSGDCEDLSTSLNAAQLTPTTINTWQWNFDDPSSGIDNEGSGQNTTHIFESADDYDVELIGTDVNGCSDTVVKTVTIEPAPEADFEFEEVCVGEIVIFDNLSSVDTPNVISNYNWSFGDGTFSGQAEPQKLFSAPGNYTVNLNATADNGCSNEISLPLKVHALPNVDYSTNASCAGIETVFDDESFVTNGSVAEVYWTFNSSPQVNGFSVEEVFETSGDQTVEQTVVSSFGCSNSDSYTINVNDYISAGFEINPNAFLADYPTAFENLSEGASSNTWTFDNLGSSNEENPSFTFPSSTIGQTLTVELLIENDFECRDSVALILPVLEPRTDLAANQLFTQSSDGFYIIGVELENKGTSPINSADLFLRTASLSVVKETWEGELKAGEKEIYIFSASPSTTVSANNEDKNFICVEAEIRTPAQFIDENLSNNTVCSAISEENAILIAPYPNPVDHELNVQIVMPFEETGTVKIYDAQGKLVNTVIQDENLKVGLSTFYVNTVNWQSGAYSIVYEGESANEVVKIVKL